MGCLLNRAMQCVEPLLHRCIVMQCAQCDGLGKVKSFSTLQFSKSFLKSLLYPVHPFSILFICLFSFSESVTMSWLHNNISICYALERFLFQYLLQGNVMECIIVYLLPHQSFLEQRAYFYFVKGAWRAYSVCLPTVWPISDLYLPSGAPLYGLWVIMGYGLWGYGEAKISVNTCLSVLHLSYSGRFKHPF